MEVFYEGNRYWILQMPGACESFTEACAGVPGNKDACPAQLVRLIKRLGDLGKLHSRDQFVHEGDGTYAIKTRCGLRAYGWFDRYRGRAAFVISHYILKKRQKFDPADQSIVEKNKMRFKETP